MNYYQILILLSAVVLAHPIDNGTGVGGEVGVGSNGVGVGSNGVGVGRPGVGVRRSGAGVGSNGAGVGGSAGVGGGINPLMARAAAANSADGTPINNSAISQYMNHHTSVAAERAQSIYEFKATNTVASQYAENHTSVAAERAQSISEFKATNTVAEAVSASVAAYTSSAAS